VASSHTSKITVCQVGLVLRWMAVYRLCHFDV